MVEHSETHRISHRMMGFAKLYPSYKSGGASIEAPPDFLLNRPQLLPERQHILGEQLRLLHRREMATMGHVCPLDQLKLPLGIAFRPEHQLTGKMSDGGRL